MDMWDPYRKTVRAHVPGADGKIVFDRFHVMRYVLKAMDHVRRQNSGCSNNCGESPVNRDEVSVADDAHARLDRRAFRELRESTLKSARAWALKEAIRRLWEFRSIPRARVFFAHWYT